MGNRLTLLGLLAIFTTAWVAWQIYARWGLVTLDVRNQPVAKVVASISRQGGIDIVSNLDPATPVSLKVKRVSPIEALDIVAVRTDASWRLAYLGAPDEKSIEHALGSFRAGAEATGWTSYSPGGLNLVSPRSGAVLDLRRVEWSPSAPGSLPMLLEDAAEKTGVLFAAPADWKPSVSASPAGPVSQVAPRLFRDAGGSVREVFLLRARPQGDDDDIGSGRGGPWLGNSSSATSGQRGGWMRGSGDTQRTEARVEAQIALLPKEEQQRARDDFQMMRDFWQSVRELPEEERRAKSREFFSRPEVAEAMETRRLSRWAKMTPDQRIQRNKNYWERKSEARREPR